MNAVELLMQNLSQIEENIGYVFENKNLLILAFVHRSFVNENKDLVSEHNERLEFLGDSVLGLVISEYLFRRLPNRPEGDLSHLRSRLVDASSCANYLLKLKLGLYILLGRGEKMGEGRAKTSILSDVFEALVGAIYLDGGLSVSKSFLLSHFEEEIEGAIGSPPRNFKAELQDYSQRKFQKPPEYKIVREMGPDHAKVFHVMVFLNDAQAGIGIGSTKKEAEQQAALEALSSLENKGQLS